MAVEINSNGPIAAASRYMGLGGPPVSSAPAGVPARTGSAAAGSGMPSPVTWFIGAIVLLYLLKVLGEHPKTPLNPHEIRIGGYNVLTILVITIIGVVGMKLLVNRPFFDRGPLAGFKGLVNAT